MSHRPAEQQVTRSRAAVPRSLSLTFSLGFGRVSMLSSDASDANLDSLRSFPGIIQNELLRPTGFLNRVQRERGKKKRTASQPGLFHHFRYGAYPAEAACNEEAATRAALLGKGECTEDVLFAF